MPHVNLIFKANLCFELLGNLLLKDQSNTRYSKSDLRILWLDLMTKSLPKSTFEVCEVHWLAPFICTPRLSYQSGGVIV